METEKRLIDVEPIKKFIVDGLNYPIPLKAFGNDAIKILAEIEYAPTVDAVEVVRCKDCKHYEIHKPKILENCERNGWLIPMKPDDFCSYGERRINNVDD